MKSVCDIPYKENLKLDLHLPDEGAFDLFVYFHGGGLEHGNRRVPSHFAEGFCKRGVAVASVEYRMYPQAKYPDFLVDAAASVRYLFDHIGEYGECKRIFAGGSSAGGYISMMLCFDGQYLGAYGLDPTDLSGYIHDAGQPTAHFRVLSERGLDPKRLVVDETAPLYHIGCCEKYAPMIFFVSDNDMFGRLEQVRLTVKTLHHFGHTQNVYLKELVGKHCEHTFKKDEAEDSVFAELVSDFIKTV